MRKISTVLFILILCIPPAYSQNASGSSSPLKLASLFANNMVLQQRSEASIWGRSAPGAKVEVLVSWNSKISGVIADEEGRWKTKVRTPEAGGPHTLSVRSVGKTIELKNVLSGEVWICSGQSNMQWKLQGFGKELWKDDVEKAHFPNIRYCQVSQVIALEEQDAVTANWSICSPKTAYGFSAVGFFFGRELHEELDVPIGLISVNWGGSSAEAWTSSDVLGKEFPEFNARLGQYPSIVSDSGGVYSSSSVKKIKGLNHRNPAVLYNGMIKPLINFGLRGVIWYQGESNVTKPVQYRKLFPSMIKDWRNQWGVGEFPFYYVQIAPFNYKRNSMSSAFLREAQTMALSLPNTGMAVTMDVGNPTDIHPKKKKPVAHRLALIALAKTYGRTELIYSGPLYKDYKVEGQVIRLAFDHVGSGLVSSDGKALSHFTIAGNDKKFVEAEAVVDGDFIVVRNKEVSNPVAVRYGWGNADIPNLSNKDGLPAASFRTDDWPIDE